MPSVFDPLRLGQLDLPNRVIMAPLTRGRSTPDHVPTPVMADYYAQRASAGLIISEATGISQQGLGWPYAPGIWNTAQVEAWKPVTEAVHRAGGRIVCQLWHMGQHVHPAYTGGAAPVSASPVTAPGRAHTYEGRLAYEPAEELDEAGIRRIVDDYARAARNAMSAGFDGVQLHAANGYLVDSFLRDSINRRHDSYGCSPENRVRFLGEATEALASEAGAGRTGVRLSPNGDSQGVIDSDPGAVFAPAARLLDRLGVAFVELREPGPDGTFGHTDQPKQSPLIRQHYSGALVLNSDFTLLQAQQALAERRADAISFGRPFIANPDLVARFSSGAALATSGPAQWYGRTGEGYSDWPLAEAPA